MTEWDIEGPNVPLDVDAVLDLLGFRWKTGKLQVLADGDAYGIHLDGGKVILATSTHRILRLGHLLLQAGAVQPLFLHDILRGARSVGRETAIGRTLVDEGAVSRDHLALGVEEQCTEILSRVLALDQATFIFAADEPLPRGIEIVPLETERLLDQARQRCLHRSAIRMIQRLLPQPDASLSFATHLAAVSYLLTDSELLVALAVDRGTTTLRRLSEALPLEPLALKRTVIGLLERGYLVVDHDLLRFAD